MDDGVRTGHDLADRVTIADVTLDDDDARILERGDEVHARATRKVVKDNDPLRLVMAQQTLDRR
ncbi:hypothetical protein D3C83_305180 [compost metagenome]